MNIHHPARLPIWRSPSGPHGPPPTHNPGQTISDPCGKLHLNSHSLRSMYVVGVPTTPWLCSKWNQRQKKTEHLEKDKLTGWFFYSLRKILFSKDIWYLDTDYRKCYLRIVLRYMMFPWSLLVWCGQGLWALEMTKLSYSWISHQKSGYLSK